MLFTFLNHQWTSFWRSHGKGSHIAVQLFMAFLILYVLACAFFIGIAMEDFIEKLLPDQDVMMVFNGFILYYFVVDLLMRLQLQELPTLAVQPYLHLNIRKRKLVNFLNIRALFSAFNLLPIFIFFPFCIMRISEKYGAAAGAMFMVSILSLALFNNYLALYVKRLSTVSARFVLVGMVLLFSFAALEYYQVFSIAAVSNIVFQQITLQPWIGIAFPVIAILVFKLNANYLYNNLYIEELSTGQQPKSATDYPFLNRFGEVGTLAAMEIKLILRNKRSRSTVSKGLIFIFYGLLFYRKELIEKDQVAMMLFAALFMTGNMVLLYGQFMFGWQGAEFDGLMANKTNIKTFIKSKFLLFTLSSTILTIIVSLYGFISWKILVIQFAAYFYNIGVSTVMVLYFATRNYNFIDLSKGSSFNWQGVGATSMLMSLPVLLFPYLIYLPFAYYNSPYMGMAAIGILGIIGIFTRKFWVDILTKEFKKRKYKIAEGFRERS
ncbi:DUF5687 family protein [Pedobacter sp.]|uniref:DUF5687 family protein n=1 Tax=Pedobacter sp. TaxID=1411316 RepID=UPI003D7FEE46